MSDRKKTGEDLQHQEVRSQNRPAAIPPAENEVEAFQRGSSGAKTIVPGGI